VDSTCSLASRRCLVRTKWNGSGVLLSHLFFFCVGDTARLERGSSDQSLGLHLCQVSPLILCTYGKATYSGLKFETSKLKSRGNEGPGDWEWKGDSSGSGNVIRLVREKYSER
jgi:hypothetical protein